MLSLLLTVSVSQYHHQHEIFERNHLILLWRASSFKRRAISCHAFIVANTFFTCKQIHQILTHYLAAIDFGEGRCWNLLQAIPCFHILHMPKIHGKWFCSNWPLFVFSRKNKPAWKLDSSQICSKTNLPTRICLQDLYVPSKFATDSAFVNMSFSHSLFRQNVLSLSRCLPYNSWLLKKL